MKIRKCGEIRKSFVIETLVKKIDFINSELDNICSNITISENTNKRYKRTNKRNTRFYRQLRSNKKCINQKDLKR